MGFIRIRVLGVFGFALDNCLGWVCVCVICGVNLGVLLFRIRRIYWVFRAIRVGFFSLLLFFICVILLTGLYFDVYVLIYCNCEWWCVVIAMLLHIVNVKQDE